MATRSVSARQRAREIYQKEEERLKRRKELFTDGFQALETIEQAELKLGSVLAELRKGGTAPALLAEEFGLTTTKVKQLIKEAEQQSDSDTKPSGEKDNGTIETQGENLGDNKDRPVGDSTGEVV